MTVKTFFASPERASREQLSAEHNLLSNARFVSTLMDAIPEIAVILNEHRQIVWLNKRLINALGISDLDSAIGKRPGELLGCIHFKNGPGGCGTAENCAVCGAVLAILTSQNIGIQSTEECRMLCIKDEGSALDLEITATPFSVEGTGFTIFAAKDISAEKRKQVLERTFFHDITNTAGGIKGIARMLVGAKTLPQEKEIKYKGWMFKLSDSLIEDIKHHRHLLEAERGEYRPTLEETDLAELLKDVASLYKNHDRAPNRQIHFEPMPPLTLATDVPILRRIVGNMLMNALEAVPEGSEIGISCKSDQEKVRIKVTNPGSIPHDVQLKIFKRSFSTKGSSGRGIGAYSMKLFGERYLGGSVGFTSENGITTFFIELPRRQSLT